MATVGRGSESIALPGEFVCSVKGTSNEEQQTGMIHLYITRRICSCAEIAVQTGISEGACGRWIAKTVRLREVLLKELSCSACA